MVIKVPSLGGRILYSARQHVMEAAPFGSYEVQRVFLKMQRKSKPGFFNRFFTKT
ncbi:MAG: hypothetical protein AAGC95_15370 [Pseudomonadota bacterium]